MYNKTKNIINNEPIPHLCIDDFFEKNLLSNLIKYWPEEKFFYDEIAGIKLFNINSTEYNKLDNEKKQFWKNFETNYVFKLRNFLTQQFYHYIKTKYGLYFPNVKIYQLNLMSACEGFIWHPPHTHHYHNPNWLFTTLIYLSANNTDECEGTDLYEPKNKKFITDYSAYASYAKDILFGGDGMDIPSIKAYSINNYPDLELEKVKEVKFKNNRLFSFLDSPISYHGVSKHVNNTPENRQRYQFGQRKILRMHCGLSSKYVKKYYGINIKEYEKLRRDRNLDKNQLDILSKEIKTVKSNVTSYNNFLSKINLYLYSNNEGFLSLLIRKIFYLLKKPEFKIISIIKKILK